MYRSNSTRVVPIIILIVVIVALVFGLVTVGKYIFVGDSSADNKSTSQARQELLTIDANHSVKMTIRGPIVADENFATRTITVSTSQRTYALYDGYLNTVSMQKTYDNNVKAYAQLVNALDKASLASSVAASTDADSLLGVCASGSVYTFSIYNGKTEEQNYWTSSCSGSPGTLAASLTQVGDLFAAQVPDADVRSKLDSLINY